MAPGVLIALALLAACGGGRGEAAAEPEPIENLVVAGDVVVEPCVERDGLLARFEACPAVGVRLHLLERKVMDLKGLDPPACADELPEMKKLALETGC